MTVLTRLFNQAPPATNNVSETTADSEAQSADSVAAIAVLDAGKPLFKLATVTKVGDVQEIAVQRAAQQRLAQLIDSGTLDINLFGRAVDIETLLSVVVSCSDPALVQQTVESIKDDNLLGKLAVDGASTKVRQLAAEAIHDPEQLREMLKDVRGKDKNVYKIIREKCDALLAIEKAAAETQIAIDNLCAALERHVYQPFDNLFAPSLEHFSTQWNGLAAHAAPEIKVRAEGAIDRCREIIAERVRALDAETARATAIANADADRQELLMELRNELSALYTQPVADRSLAQYVERWSELNGRKPASAIDKETFLQLRKSTEEVATLVAQHGTVAQQVDRLRDTSPDIDLASQAQTLSRLLNAASLLGDSVPDVVVDAQSVLQDIEQARKDKQATKANALRQLGGLIRKASGALNGGNTRLAGGLRRAVEEKLKSVPVVPPHLTKQLQQLDEKLNVLQDWRNYAVAPKRIELIEHMEALIEMDESPPMLANQIKRLQDEWKVISKGNTDDTDAEWQRFHQAAQKAYQPCSEYFAAQAKQREGNLAKRKTLLDRLTNFVAAQDWSQESSRIDWREVARALRESKQQWRNHQQVERAANKPLQKAFDALTRELESHLEGESARNVKAKRALIARAKALLTDDDSRQAIDAVKQLQAAWKDIGIVARDDDQKLWAEFREQCDAVFAKRQQQHSEYVSTLTESKKKAIALCEEAEQLLTLSGLELIEGSKKISALSELFEALGELPKADGRALNMRFERALKQCEKAVAAQRAREKAQAWNNVLDTGDKIRVYRLALLDGSPEEQEAVKQSVQTFIDSIQYWPKGGLQVIKSELAKQDATNTSDNETALRTICVRAEILTDFPTPQADQAFRRSYQLQRLMKGVGQASAATKDQLDAMVYEWVGVGATSDDVYGALLARFTHCRSKQ